MANDSTDSKALLEDAPVTKAEPTPPSPLEKHKETLGALKADARWPLRNMGEHITPLKSMFEDTANGNHVEVLN